MSQTENNYNIYCAGSYGSYAEQVMLIIEGMSRDNHVLKFYDNSKEKQNREVWGRKVIDPANITSETMVIIAYPDWTESYAAAEELEKKGLIKGRDYDVALEMEVRGELDSEHIVQGIRRNFELCTPIIFGDPVLMSDFVIWCDQNKLKKPMICNSPDEIGAISKAAANPLWIPLNHTYYWTTTAKAEELCQPYYDANCSNFGKLFIFEFIYCMIDEKSEPSIICERYGVEINGIVSLTWNAFSGQYFVNSLFDGHPQMAFLGNTSWGFDIYYVVKCLEKSNNISESFSELFERYSDYYGEKWSEERKEQYLGLLTKYFPLGKQYSKFDIFVGLHLANYELVHHKTPTGKLSIYVDPHSKGEDFFNPMMHWFESLGIPVTLLKPIRRPIIRQGSKMHYNITSPNLDVTDKAMRKIVHDFIWNAVGDYSEYGQHRLISFRFEDMKLHPREILSKMIKYMDIDWDDSLLTTTLEGEEFYYKENTQYTVSGFDLKPVFNMYEDYFSPFDRMRLEYIYRFRNKAYGYPAVEENEYPDEMIENMEELFEKPWRFEKYMHFENEEDRNLFHHEMRMCFKNLVSLSKDAMANKYFRFNEYIKL